MGVEFGENDRWVAKDMDAQIKPQFEAPQGGRICPGEIAILHAGD